MRGKTKFIYVKYICTKENIRRRLHNAIQRFQTWRMVLKLCFGCKIVIWLYHNKGKSIYGRHSVHVFLYAEWLTQDIIIDIKIAAIIRRQIVQQFKIITKETIFDFINMLRDVFSYNRA